MIEIYENCPILKYELMVNETYVKIVWRGICQSQLLGLSGRARKHPSNVFTLPGVYIWLILTFIDWFLGKIGFAKHLKLPPSANRLVTGSDRIHDALEPSQRLYFIQYQDFSHASSIMKSFRAKCFCNPGTNLMLLSRANSRNSFCHYFWRNLTQYKFGIRDRRATRSRVS